MPCMQWLLLVQGVSIHLCHFSHRDKLAELHGNMFVEECMKCGKYVGSSTWGLCCYPGEQWRALADLGLPVRRVQSAWNHDQICPI